MAIGYSDLPNGGLTLRVLNLYNKNIRVGNKILDGEKIEYIHFRTVEEITKAYIQSLNYRIRFLEVIPTDVMDLIEQSMQGEYTSLPVPVPSNGYFYRDEFERFYSEIQEKLNYSVKKEDIESAFLSLGEKADRSDIESIASALERKADVEQVENVSSGLEAKADKEEVEGISSALEKKADKSDIENISTALENKADVDQVEGFFTTLEAKADKEVIEGISSVLDDKADKTEVESISSALEKKADVTKIDNLSTSLNYKADKTAVDTLSSALGEKADKVEVDDISSTLGEKADKTEVESVTNLLEEKTDKEETEAITSALEVTTSQVDVERNISPSLNTLWEPPEMPAALRGKGNIPTEYNPDIQLAALIDPLVDGEYVTKRSIGRDQSDTYDIWCYEFTPQNPEKTILLTTSIHGNEYTGFYWIAQFLDILVNQWQKYPQFAYLRKNVRLVTVPIANPWGHANQKRYNVSDVDCSRNFDYNWGAVFDEYNQGTAAWSEAESRAIRDLMAEIADECVAALDFHTTLSEGSTHHILYYPRFLNNNVNSYLALIEEMKKPGETTALASTALPTLTNYGIFTHGFNSANPEFMNGLSGSTRDSAEMTRAMRFFGNFVFQAAKQPFKNKGTTLALPSMASIRFDYRKSSPITFGTTTYTSQATKTSIKFKSKSEGLFEVQGHITVTSTADATISILPHLYQVKSPDFGFNTSNEDEFNATIFDIKAGEEKIVPFQAEILCHKTNVLAKDNTNDRAQEVVFQLRTKTTAGSGSIKFINAKAKLTPTTSGDRFKRYTLNPTTLVYPNTQGVTYEF